MTHYDCWLILNALSGVGTVRLNSLLEHFGSPEEILKADDMALRQAGILPEAVIHNIINFSKDKFLEDEYNLMGLKGVEFISRADSQYPALLKEIPGAPTVLYILGNKEALSSSCIGIVGSRAASFYGKKIAGEFATTLVQAGITVVSGLARGIDTAAHQACVRAKAPTVAVMGCGFNYIYPQENVALYKEIIACGGAVITEFPMGVAPSPSNFPPRNRIISGLSQAVVIVEAAKKSGALITVDYALEQGRDVYVVPGPIDSLSSQGSNRLIQDGAKVALSPQDVLSSVKHDWVGSEEIIENQGSKIVLSPEEFKVFELTSSQPLSIDEIMGHANVGIAEFNSTILSLQLKQLVRQLPGQYYVRI